MMQPSLTRRRRSWRSGQVSVLLVQVLSYLFLVALAAVTLGPFVVMMSASLTPEMNVLIFPLSLIPNPIGLDNYIELFSRTLVARWLWNSTVVTTVGTIAMLLTSSMAGYAFARGEFIGKTVLFMAFLGILMVPMTVRIVPIYMLMSKLHWINTYWVLIGPWSASAFGTFFMRQQFASIPQDYDDAAIVDGASKFQVLFRVLLPQVKPGLVTLGILRFMSHWNDFLYPMILTSKPAMRTLTVGLSTMHFWTGAAGLQMAGAVMGFLPTFVLFLIGQRFIVEGITLTGIRG
jgi:multiple sugar transport system permease protein